MVSLRKIFFFFILYHDSFTQAFSHRLLPSFGEVIRNGTRRKSYVEEKCKMGKDEDFGSERCTDWCSSSPAAVYWAQSGWERGFSMLSMLWSSQLPSLGSKTVEGSIHQPFYLHSADLHFPPSSPTSRVWFGSILSTKETPNNSTATERSHRSDLPTRYGRTLDWLWDSVFWLGLAYWGQFHPILLKHPASFTYS